jgi:Protein of unknown function (DUF2934)
MASAAQRKLEVEKSSTELTESLPPAPGIAAHENPPALTSVSLSAEDIYRLIQEAAFFKAEARNFAPGVELQDWLEAENEVKKRLQLS